jgi:PTH1 family peptidyl-tRNA hydrolase
MNLSGKAVVSVLSRLKTEQNRFIVIVDDFNLPIGKIRIRSNGSHGGHNGLKSITEYIGDDFPRMRVGIGPLPKKVSVTDFVLGKFNQTEEYHLKEVIPTTLDALEFFTAQSIDAVMNKYN